MEDPILNRNLEETKELQTRWSQFHDFCVMAMQQGPMKITPQAEMKFLELKSRIAMLHDGFMAGIKHDVKAGMNIIQIVCDCILLKRVANYSDAEKAKFEFDWNEGFLLLNQSVSDLEQEQKRLAGISERKHNMEKRKELIKAKVHNFFHSNQLKWAITALIVIAVVYVIPAFFWSYRNLASIKPLKGTYTFVVNSMYRPFLSADYEYNDDDELEVDKKFNATPDRVSREDTKGLTAEYFRDSVLPYLGVAAADLPRAQEIFNKRKRGYFQREHLKADGDKIIQVYSFLTDTSAEAKELVTLVKNGLAANPQAKQIKDSAIVVRKANFVIVGLGQHPHRNNYIAGTWKIKELKDELAQ